MKDHQTQAHFHLNNSTQPLNMGQTLQRTNSSESITPSHSVFPVNMSSGLQRDGCHTSHRSRHSRASSTISTNWMAQFMEKFAAGQQQLMVTIQEKEMTKQIEQQKLAAEKKRAAKEKKLKKNKIAAEKEVELQKLATQKGDRTAENWNCGRGMTSGATKRDIGCSPAGNRTAEEGRRGQENRGRGTAESRRDSHPSTRVGT